MVDEAPPYCRACDALHEEATCPIVERIINNRMFGASNQINVVGKEFSLSMEDWMEVKENSQDVRPSTSSHSINNFDHERDLITELFGEKPSPDQVLEIAKDKGLTYQRRDKE